jgi:hypothetical protein
MSRFVRSTTPSPRPAARRPDRPARSAFLAGMLGAVSLALSLPARGQDCLPLADVTPVGHGTPGLAGVPELLAVGVPAVGQPGMGLRVVHGAPGAAAQIVVGGPGAATPLPGYGALLHPSAPFARFAVRLDGSGASPALFQTPAPTSPILCGLEFVAQGLVLDASAQGGAAFTGGLRLRLGAGQAAAGLYDLMLHYLVPNAGKTARPALAVGDLDGTGRPDVVVPTGSGLTADLRVLRQLSDGTFAPPLAFPLNQAAGAVDLVLADLDDDGLLDAAVAHSNSTSNSVLLLRGQGDGTLAPFEIIGPAADGRPVALAAGDVTGDGRADLIVAGWTATSVAVLAGPIGAGPVVPAALVAMSPSAVVRGARLGDVDDDGLLDVLVLLGGAAPEVLVARSLGGGAFAAPQLWPTGLSSGAAIDVGDVDGDGDSDAVVAATPAGLQQQLAVLLSDGAGGRAAAHTFPLPPFQLGSSVELVLGELDDDALPEILVTWDNYLGLRLTNLGGGQFAAPEEVDSTGTRSRLADMDGDGRVDLVTLNEVFFLSGVWWQAGDGQGAFALPPPLPAGMPNGPTLSADLDGDGDLDLLGWPGLGVQPSRLGVTLNDGAAHFGPVTLHDTGGSVRDVVVADMDGDGVLDVVAAGSAGASVFRGVGDGSLQAPVLVPMSATFVVRAADTDGDGLPELIVGSSFFPPALRVFPNLGGLSFGTPAETPLAVNPRNFDVGDLDGDGFPEAVVQAGNGVLVLGGTGAPAFGPPVPLTAPGSSSGIDFPVRLADVDGDGDLDMLRRTFDPRTQVWLNDGIGGLVLSQSEWWEAFGPLSVADVNGDGALDVVGEGVMLGLGGGLFAAPQPGAVANVYGDLDGDGHPDGAAFARLFLNCSN